MLTLRSELEPEVGELPKGWTVAAQLRAAEGRRRGRLLRPVRLRDGGIGLIVVDIAGHGATEGILALRCKEMLRASLAADVAPGDAVEATAEKLGDMGAEVFLTAFVAVIDTEDGSHPVRERRASARLRQLRRRYDVDLEPTGPLVGP